MFRVGEDLAGTTKLGLAAKREHKLIAPGTLRNSSSKPDRLKSRCLVVRANHDPRQLEHTGAPVLQGSRALRKCTVASLLLTCVLEPLLVLPVRTFYQMSLLLSADLWISRQRKINSNRLLSFLFVAVCSWGKIWGHLVLSTTPLL